MGRGGNGREKRARTDVQPRGVREGLGRFRALLKRAESGSIPLPGPSKTHCPALAFHAPPVAAHFALSGSRFLDSGFAYARNDNGNGDSAFGGIPLRLRRGPYEGKGIEVRWTSSEAFGRLIPLPGGTRGCRPSGQPRSGGGENSLLHEKSPANAELFSWSIGDSNP